MWLVHHKQISVKGVLSINTQKIEGRSLRIDIIWHTEIDLSEPTGLPYLEEY